MLNHKGTQEIRTDRLLLRKIKTEDYKDINIYTSKEEVAKYVTWTVHKNIDETKALCERWANECKDDNRYFWVIVYNNKVIGNIDVIKIVDETAYLGWQMDSEYWNKGIMTEAATAVRNYLFGEIGIEAIEAAHIKENIGSGRVMQKIGMKEIPVLESLFYQLEHKTEINGMPVVCRKMSKTDWNSYIKEDE